MDREFNISINPEGYTKISRVLVCDQGNCNRTIVEYSVKYSNVSRGSYSTHSRGLSDELVEQLITDGLVVYTKCNHHGGRLYNPYSDHPIIAEGYEAYQLMRAEIGESVDRERFVAEVMHDIRSLP